MIFLVSVIQEKILCLVDGSRLDKYAEVLICRFVYRILPRIYKNYAVTKSVQSYMCILSETIMRK